MTATDRVFAIGVGLGFVVCGIVIVVSVIADLMAMKGGSLFIGVIASLIAAAIAWVGGIFFLHGVGVLK